MRFRKIIALSVSALILSVMSGCVDQHPETQATVNITENLILSIKSGAKITS